MVAPNRSPQGFKDSLRSSMTFITATSGIERNIPGIPHKEAPAMTTIIDVRALSFTLEPTILGIMK